MDRTFAARAARRPRPLPQLGVGALAGALGAPGALLRALLGAARSRRRLRIALVAVALALPLLGGGWLWLRHSSFVAVRDVRIEGVHGADAATVEAALAEAARRMSTLDVNVGALRAAVAPLHVVSAVHASARFPHGLTIDVVEQPPVASLDVAGVRTALAADGVALGPSLLSASLPTVDGSFAPAPGERVHGNSLLEALAVLGAAPAALAPHVERIYMGAHGLTATMRNGLVVYFGNDALAHAKWLSLARVLADSGAAGATYVDVRLPSRPAAGFPAGVTPPDASGEAVTSTGEQTASTESTVAALAAGLTQSTGVGSTPSASASDEPGSQAGSGAPESTSGGESEQGTGTAPASTEAASAGSEATR